MCHRRSKNLVIGKLRYAAYSYPKNFAMNLWEISQVDIQNLFFEIFEFVLAVFFSSFLIRSGNWLRRSYNQTNMGEMSSSLSKN